MQFGGWEATRVGALLAMSFMTQNAQATYGLTALDDAGTVVGIDDNLGAMGDPFIWNAGLTTTLGGDGITSVTGIDNSSQILGAGFNPSGPQEAVPLTPAVAEPGSSALMLAGLAVLGALAWRQRDD